MPSEGAGTVSFSMPDPEAAVWRLAAHGIIVSAKAGEEIERLVGLVGWPGSAGGTNRQSCLAAEPKAGEESLGRVGKRRES
jgi:hypothetical protein